MCTGNLATMFGFERAGKLVPLVNPSDLKALWALGEENRKTHPEGGAIIGRSLMQGLCKTGAECEN